MSNRREDMVCDALEFPHVHYWRLESPHGQRTVRGTCSFCGATREFEAGWNEPSDPCIARDAARAGEVQRVRLEDFGMRVISDVEEAEP